MPISLKAKSRLSSKKKILGVWRSCGKAGDVDSTDKPPAEDLAHLRRFLSRFNRGEVGKLDVLKVLVSMMKRSLPAHAIHLFNEVKNSKVQLIPSPTTRPSPHAGSAYRRTSSSSAGGYEA